MSTCASWAMRYRRHAAPGARIQGCGMASVTLKQGIERILKDAIPELLAVEDVTDHASGTDPYYEAAKK